MPGRRMSVSRISGISSVMLSSAAMAFGQEAVIFKLSFSQSIIRSNPSRMMGSSSTNNSLYTVFSLLLSCTAGR